MFPISHSSVTVCRSFDKRIVYLSTERSVSHGLRQSERASRTENDSERSDEVDPTMSSGKPTRQQSDLADVLELVLDKGIVVNADIAVTVGDTELLGIEIRAAIASFETAAEYGLAFPSGTDMRRVEQASGREPLEADSTDEVVDVEGRSEDRAPVDLGINASEGGAQPITPNDDRDGSDDSTGNDSRADADAGAGGNGEGGPDA